jgi:hypothetical protein
MTSLTTATVISFEWGVPMTPVTNDKRIGKMTWNYRVVFIPKSGDSLFDDDQFVIREVYYNEDEEIEFWSEEDSTPFGETFEELASDFDLMQEAFEKPILMLTQDEDGEDKLVELDDEEEEEDDEAEEA